MDVLGDQQKYSHANGQAEYMESRKEFVFFEIPESPEQNISDHGTNVFTREQTCK
jgi:hypothetical protein